MAKMDDAILLGIIDAEEYGVDDSQLNYDRDRALDYYYGRAVGDLAVSAIPEDSRYVSRDVADTIDWIMPALMKTFLAGDDIVTFAPRSKEDVPAAEQETDYINHIISDLNPVYEIFSTWFDDALIQKNGYTYAYWDTQKDIEEERYTGLMMDQITMLTQDDDVEIVESKEVQVGDDEMGQPIMAYDVVLKRTNTKGKICIENIPPELIKVSWRHRKVRLQEATFVGFDAHMSLSDLREAGFDVDDDISDIVTSGVNTEETSLAYRNRFSITGYNQHQDTNDPAAKVVRVRYRWMRVDFDGDGIAELRYLILIGKEILLNEKADIIPIAAITPRIVSHNHIGRSVEEVVSDLQELKTKLIRGLINNVHLANNGRYGVDQNIVNLDDMMVSRPGGMVRVDGPPAGSIVPLQHQMLGAPVMGALEMVDGIRETRTGVTKYNMGQDAGNLNKTATGISIINAAANQRIEWIARTFAETGVKELFGIVHSLIRKHQDKEAVVRLRNQWVSIDPREWKKRNDMTVSVGLGSINRQEQSGGIMRLGQLQKEAFQAGIVSPENIFNMAEEFTKSIGFKDVEKFFTRPENMPQKPAQLDPKMEKIKADVAMSEEARKLEREKMGLKQQEVHHDQQVQVGTMVGQTAANILPMVGGL